MQTDRRFSQTQDDFVAEDLRQMKLAVKYNEWIYSLIKPYVGQRIFEVGSGIGNITRHLVDSGDLVFGIEPNQACSDELEGTFRNNPAFKCKSWSIEECNKEALKDFQFDTIVCVNVLEHIEDDIEVLKFFQSVLVEGGKAVLVVPAIPWAYGSIDKAVGHFRRYSKKMMSKAMSHIGLTVTHMKYSNLLGLIGWYDNGNIRKIIKQSDSQIRLFEMLVPVYHRFEKVLPVPIGMTLVAVGEKDK